MQRITICPRNEDATDFERRRIEERIYEDRKTTRMADRSSRQHAGQGALATLHCSNYCGGEAGDYDVLGPDRSNNGSAQWALSDSPNHKMYGCFVYVCVCTPYIQYIPPPPSIEHGLGFGRSWLRTNALVLGHWSVHDVLRDSRVSFAITKAIDASHCRTKLD